jgi:hypothetical protein
MAEAMFIAAGFSYRQALRPARERSISKSSGIRMLTAPCPPAKAGLPRRIRP